MNENKKNNMLTLIYILSVLSVALLVASIIVLVVGASREPMQGETGKSAYELAVQNGFHGSEEEWIESLVGAEGAQGIQGEQGKQGEQGEKGVGIESVSQKFDKWNIASWFEFTFTDRTTSDTRTTPIINIDHRKSYQAENEHDRATLLSYGVSPDRIFTAETVQEQLEMGGTISAVTDIEIDAASTLHKDITLELNGNKLVLAGNAAIQVEEGTNVIVRGGILESTASDAIAPQRSVFLARKDASLTFEDIVYTGNSPLACPAENSCLTLRDCTVTTSGYYAISTNATYGENMTILIENSRISALREVGAATDGDATAVLINVPCDLTIRNSELKGSRQALVVRCGNACVMHSSLVATGAFPERDKYLNANWSQGNEVPVGSLVIGNRSYAAYQSPAHVELTDTNISAPDGVSSVYLYGNETEEIGASLLYDEESEVGEIIVGGGYVTVNGVRKEATQGSGFARFFPFLPEFPRIRHGN